jgi:hypothetical protein
VIGETRLWTQPGPPSGFSVEKVCPIYRRSAEMARHEVEHAKAEGSGFFLTNPVAFIRLMAGEKVECQKMESET